MTLPQISPLTTITDNWLLQDVAGLLSRKADPGLIASKPVITTNKLDYVGIPYGVVQIDCLASLLEQIVLSETIYVMAEYIDTWKGKFPQLDHLQNQSFIQPIPSSQLGTDNYLNDYIKRLCRESFLIDAHNDSMKAMQNNEASITGQIIYGTAGYLSCSEATGYSYCPHPTRTSFLKQTIWYNEWPARPIKMFDKIIDEKRLRLFKYSYQDEDLTTLITFLPSISAICIHESSEDLSPIDIAIQLRENNSIKIFRKYLVEYGIAIAKDDITSMINLRKQLVEIVNDADKAILSGNNILPNGTTIINVLSMDETKNNSLLVNKANVIGIVHNLISSGIYDIPEDFARKLGIKEKRVIDYLKKNPHK